MHSLDTWRLHPCKKMNAGGISTTSMTSQKVRKGKSKAVAKNRKAAANQNVASSVARWGFVASATSLRRNSRFDFMMTRLVPWPPRVQKNSLDGGLNFSSPAKNSSNHAWLGFSSFATRKPLESLSNCQLPQNSIGGLSTAHRQTDLLSCRS